jgi:hypothetical protein
MGRSGFRALAGPLRDV